MSHVPTPLFVLAFDHRQVLRQMFPEVPDERFSASKLLVLDAIAEAGRRGAQNCGYLVDEEYGAAAARAAKERGITLVMPAEASRTPELVLQYGDDFPAHIEAFQPDIVKALVFHAVSDDVERKKRQLDLLGRLRDWCTDHGYPLMLEVLIPQLAAAGRYDHGQVLYRELHASIAELQDAGIEADIWKIDGLEHVEHAGLVAEQAAQQNLPTTCVVLGSGASVPDVEGWLRNAARAPGYGGFAVGRSVWAESLRGYFEGVLTYDDAVSAIADTYHALVRTYQDA